MTDRLSNKVALVTGAGSGIGLASALLFAEEGAQMVCADIIEKTVKDTAELVRAKTGRSGLAISVDVTEPAEVHKMIRGCIAEYGKLDVLYAKAD